MNNVLLDIDKNGVATVTINRPEKHNAFDEHVIAELTDSFAQLAGNEQVRVMVLRSAGRNFCAGADLDWMKRMAAYSRKENVKDANALAGMLYQLNYLPIPTIARVQGAALGGGAGLVCCCDIVIAANDATFALSEVKFGLLPATISPYVIASIGAKSARRYFLTAERFDADTAKTIGMVSEIMAEEELDEKISSLITTILNNGPNAVRAAKQLIFDVDKQAITRELMQTTSERIADIRASEEGREGLSAFLEKRKPFWIKK